MFNIEQWVAREFRDYQEYGNPVTDLKVDCPFCGDDYKQHLHISLDKQAVHCFRCGYSSNWVDLVMKVSGLPYHLALGELYTPPKIRGDVYEEVISKMTQDQWDAEYLGRFSLPDDFKVLDFPRTNDRIAYGVRKYLLGRGFSPKHWEHYKLGFAPSQGYRVIIPIERDYWQGRTIFDWDKPKYINPKAESGSVIFNSPALELYEQVVICEGAFSAMAVGENAVALIGKEPTYSKIERLLGADVEDYIIALEPKAFKTMRRLMDALHKGGKKLEIWNYAQGDPADSDDYSVMDYGLKTRLSLAMPPSKFRRSK
jgi:DNA primase